MLKLCSHRLAGLLAVFAALALAHSTQAAEVPGLQQEKPSSGRYVKTDQGYMVPYKMTIPGTEGTFEMIPVPGGTFTIGSAESEKKRGADEGPQFQVRLEPFWMGKYEITWSEYKPYMALYAAFKEFKTRSQREVNKDTEVDAITAPTELYDPSFTFVHGEDPRQPAVTMTQYAAKQYTKWLSLLTGQQYRLPSEAEWEYACRAGSQTAYSYGDDPDQLDDYGWYFDNSDETTHVVGEKKPNPWGLYDMHGNVAEWVLDAYDEKGYKKPAQEPVSAADSVAWPTKLYPRVVRGGHWDHDPEDLRSAARMASHDENWKSEDPNLPLSPWWFTSDPARGVGFRIVRPLRKMDQEELVKVWEADVQSIRDDVNNRLLEGRGVRGVVDPKLPAALKELQE